MKLTAKTQDIVVTPSICEGEEKPFSIVFRYPTQLDIMRLSGITDNGEAVTFINSLFKEFVDKPVLEDEEGKEIAYESFEDMMNYGGGDLTSILTDVVNHFHTIGEKSGKVEKKS